MTQLAPVLFSFHIVYRGTYVLLPLCDIVYFMFLYKLFSLSGEKPKLMFFFVCLFF